MPASSPQLTEGLHDRLTRLGASLRARRRALKLTAVVVAEAAGISRVTLHRIERGEASVTMGAYMLVADVLGWEIAAGKVGGTTPDGVAKQDEVPVRIRLADYPVLARLAWQVSADEVLTPREALDVYERNWRHVDRAELSGEEQALIDNLRKVFGDQPSVV